MIEQFLIGSIVGGMLVGSSVQRTISVSRGDMNMTFWSGAANSLFYYLSIKFVVMNNIEAYLGTCVGSSIVILLMANRNRNK